MTQTQLQISRDIIKLNFPPNPDDASGYSRRIAERFISSELGCSIRRAMKIFQELSEESWLKTNFSRFWIRNV